MFRKFLQCFQFSKEPWNWPGEELIATTGVIFQNTCLKVLGDTWDGDKLHGLIISWIRKYADGLDADMPWCLRTLAAEIPPLSGFSSRHFQTTLPQAEPMVRLQQSQLMDLISRHSQIDNFEGFQKTGHLKYYFWAGLASPAPVDQTTLFCRLRRDTASTTHESAGLQCQLRF
jgi:hypothetical protein